MPFQDPGERKDCRRSRDACQEAAAMQWIRHANLQHGRAPQSHEVLSKLSNRFEGREGSPDCQRWVAMTGSEKKTPAPIPATLGLEERPFRDGCRIVAGNEKNKGHLCMSPPHIRLPHAWMYMRTSNQALCLSVEIPPVRVVSRRVQHQCPDQVCVPPMTFRLGNASFRLGGHPLGDDIGTARN